MKDIENVWLRHQVESLPSFYFIQRRGKPSKFKTGIWQTLLAWDDWNCRLWQRTWLWTSASISFCPYFWLPFLDICQHQLPRHVRKASQECRHHSSRIRRFYFNWFIFCWVQKLALFRLLPPAAILDKMKEIGRFWVPLFHPRWPTNKLTGGNKRKSAQKLRKYQTMNTWKLDTSKTWAFTLHFPHQVKIKVLGNLVLHDAINKKHFWKIIAFPRYLVFSFICLNVLLFKQHWFGHKH